MSNHKFKILGWTSKGMRCPDVNINFPDNSKVDFIQMMNGTGKTSMLTLLKLALTNETNLHKLEESLDKHNQIGNLHGLVHEKKTKGEFCVRTKINDVNYDFTLEIDKKYSNLDTIKFTTRSTKTQGIEQAWSPPEHAKVFLNTKFINVFLYDAEHTNTIFELDKDYAKRAIDTVCQIEILKNAKDRIKTVIENKIYALGNKGTKRTEDNALNKLRSAEEYLKVLEADRKKATQDISVKSKEIEKLSLSIKLNNEKNEKYILTNKGLEKDARNNERDTDVLKSKFRQRILNPAELHKTTEEYLDLFSNTLDKASLPASVASNFFQDISKEATCICGRDIGEDEETYILKNSEKYLDINLNTTLGSILTAIGFDDSGDKSIESLNDISIELTKLINEEDRIRVAKDLNDKKNGANKENAEAHERTGKLKKDIETLEKEIKDADAPLDKEDIKNGRKDIETILSIKAVKRVIDDYRSRLNMVAEAKELNKILRVIDSVLTKTKMISKEKIIEQVTINMNEKLPKILTETVPVPKILEISDHIKTHPERLNVGSQKVINYVFFHEALKFSKLDLPFIVDSPVGAMDNVNRKNWARDLPNITNQFITFITPPDRNHFFDPLVESAGEMYCSYVTVFNRSPLINKWIEESEIQDCDINLTEDTGYITGIKHMREFDEAFED